MNPQLTLLEDAQQSLHRVINTVAGGGSVEEAFVGWLLTDQMPEIELSSIALSAIQRIGAERTYREAAILGFAVNAGAIENAAQDAMSSILRQLAGRSHVVNGNPMQFCNDSVALLGIALGANAAGTEIRDLVFSWASKFLPNTFGLRGTPVWEKCLVATANTLLGGSSLDIPSDDDAADIRLALVSKGLLKSNSDVAAEMENALTILRTVSLESPPPCLAALKLAAIKEILSSCSTLSLKSVSALDVATILHKVPAALERWVWEVKPRTAHGTPRQWNIDNEYHVQSLLFAILRPIFPDLTEEEFTPKVGSKNPKADICIPSLHLIIEAKFWRVDKSTKDILEEIAQDTALYLVSGSRYSSIIAFIWDDANRSNEHDILLRGLRQLTGVLDAVIVSRPGRFL